MEYTAILVLTVGAFGTITFIRFNYKIDNVGLTVASAVSFSCSGQNARYVENHCTVDGLTCYWRCNIPVGHWGRARLKTNYLLASNKPKFS